MRLPSGLKATLVTPLECPLLPAALPMNHEVVNPLLGRVL
jgi:hypothetical protein